MTILRWPLLALGLLTLSGCDRLVGEVKIDLPFPDTTAYVEIWSDGMESRYELVVKNGFGEAKKHLWTDWGPATHANAYVTPENFVIVIGPFGCCSAIQIDPKRPPRLAEAAEIRHLDSESWTYLGSVSKDEAGKGRFFPSAERRECISNHGVSGGPHRAKFQVPRECSN